MYKFNLIFAVFITWLLINSDWFITKNTERELSTILHAGTKKEDVVNHLKKLERSANDTNGRYYNGKCATAHSGDFWWNCEYASYVQTGWDAGVLGLFDPHVMVFFVFNEKNLLVNHYISISYTFV